MKNELRLVMQVNGTEYHITTGTNRTLAEVLRDDLGLLGTKIGCNKGECGACTVIMNGRTVVSCPRTGPAGSGGGDNHHRGRCSRRETVCRRAGLHRGRAVQCGFCTPGMVMSAEALRRTIAPTDAEIATALEGNLCRCHGLPQDHRGGAQGQRKRMMTAAVVLAAVTRTAWVQTSSCFPWGLAVSSERYWRQPAAPRMPCTSSSACTTR